MYFDENATRMRIRQLRKERGLTQEQLGEQLNISARSMRYAEEGQRHLSVDLLADMAIFFDVSMDFLVFGKDRTSSDVREGLREAMRILAACEEKL